MNAVLDRPKAGEMARKARPAPKEPDPYHVRLRRLVDARRGSRTYEEIAERAGMNKQALSRLLTGGVTDPRLSTLEAVLKAVGANLCDFEEA
jgi:DNA-binding phage protein